MQIIFAINAEILGEARALGGFTDQQIAEVVNYVRSHFGNRYRDAIKPADVAAMR